MKTSFVSYSILVSTLFLFISCEVVEKPLKIEVDVFTPLATKADTTLPEPFLTLIQPVNFGDTLMYIPSVFYKRVDLRPVSYTHLDVYKRQDARYASAKSSYKRKIDNRCSA